MYVCVCMCMYERERVTDREIFWRSDCTEPRYTKPREVCEDELVSLTVLREFS